MAKGSESPLPSVILEEVLSDGSTLSSPSADHRRLFLGEDGLLHLKDSAAGVTDVGGAAGSSRPYLDTYSSPLDGTYGDDFDGASLNARWTRKNISSGWETYQSAGGSWLRVGIASATVPQQYQQTLPGGGADWEFIAAMTYFRPDASGTMVGLVAYDGSGNGRGPVCYIQDRNAYHGVIAAYAYSSHAGGIVDYITPNGKKIWYRLAKSGTTYSAQVSQDGSNWSKIVSATDATTYTTIAIGRFLGSNTDDIFCVDLFDRVS